MTAKAIPVLTEKDKARFWAKVDKTRLDSGCWIWIGMKQPNGYGRFRIAGRNFPAHRVSFVLAGGTFDRGPIVLHGPCNRRDCVNPLHLSSGTQKQNIADKERDGTVARGDRNGARLHPENLARGDRNGARTRPESRARGDRNGARLYPEKRRRGEDNNKSKLTAENVMEIRDRLSAGESQRSLAKVFSVSKGLITFIAHRKIWKHI